jgi:hypothetical protein
MWGWRNKRALFPSYTEFENMLPSFHQWAEKPYSSPFTGGRRGETSGRTSILPYPLFSRQVEGVDDWMKGSFHPKNPLFIGISEDGWKDGSKK